jgi:hypothetical protein
VEIPGRGMDLIHMVDTMETQGEEEEEDTEGILEDMATMIDMVEVTAMAMDMETLEVEPARTTMVVTPTAKDMVDFKVCESFKRITILI